MRYLAIITFITICAVSGFSQQTPTNALTPRPASSTNTFSVVLLDGFDGKDTVVLAIDGREVYKGKPKSPVLAGCAASLWVTAATPQPVVSLEWPATHTKWSSKFDLSAGLFISLSIETNGVAAAQRKTGGGYD